MRILHTGDWHVGRTLHRRQRLDEAADVLEEVVDVTTREKVDVVLVCGDVFEHYAPSAEAEQIVYRTLLALRAAGADVVVVPGNHDNAKRFRAVEELLAAAGIRVVPEVRRPSEGGVLEVTASDGTRAQIACLPWVPERLLYTAADLMGAQAEPVQEYAEELPRLIRGLCAGLDSESVTLLVGHLFVSGARLGGGERELTIGQIFAINPAALPTTVQYIALGHVHRPQDVPGSATPARYAGSLLSLDFGEAGQQKSVTVVEVEPGRPAAWREVPVAKGRALLDVVGTLGELQVREDIGDAWLRVTLRCDGPQPGLADQVRELLPNAVEVRLDYPREDPERRTAELRRLAPRELFERYYRERHGAPAKDVVLKLFDELLDEVTDAAA